MSTQDSLQAMLAAQLTPKAGFLGLPDYVDPNQSKALMNKIAMLNYAQQYSPQQQGAVQAGQGFGGFLSHLAGQAAQGHPNSPFLQNLSGAVGGTPFPQYGPQSPPQGGQDPSQADQGGAQPPMNGQDPTQGGGSPPNAGPGASPGLPQGPGAAQGAAPQQGLPGTQPMTKTDQMLQGYYLKQLDSHQGDALAARIDTLQQAVRLGRYGATEQLDKAQDDLVKRNKLAAEEYKDRGQGFAAFDEPGKRAFEKQAGTWTDTYTDPAGYYKWQTNGNGETRRVEGKNPLTMAQVQSAPVDPSGISGIVDAIVHGRIPALSGAVMKTPWGQAVMSAVVAHPEYDSTNQMDKQTTVKQYTPGGSEGKALSAFNVALNHGDTLMKNVEGLENGDVQAVNAVKNVLGKNFGATGPGAVALAAHLYSSEIEKTVIQNGGTADERNYIHNLFKDANSAPQFKIAVDTANEMLIGKVRNSRQNWETHVWDGKAPEGAFEKKFLSPTAQRLAAGNKDYQDQFAPPKAPAAGGFTYLGKEGG